MFRRTHRGFTLLELLVALAIFALLAVLAYATLGTVLNTSDQTAVQAERLARLQTVYRVLQQDFDQAVAREVRGEYGDALGALQAGAGVELTRAGLRNPSGQLRSSMQRVGYQLRGETLVRQSWLVLDRAQDTVPREQVMVDGVTGMQMRFLGNGETWHEIWPPPGEGTNSLPRAVEINLDLENWGEIRWLFQLPK